jgi:hypothetical protein
VSKKKREREQSVIKKERSTNIGVRSLNESEEDGMRE